MKEIILDLAEVTREQYPTVDMQLADFGVPLLPVLKLFFFSRARQNSSYKK